MKKKNNWDIYIFPAILILIGGILYGMFKWFIGLILLIAGILLLALMIYGEAGEKQRKQTEQAAEQQAEQKKQEYAELIELVEEYIQDPNHSAQDAQEVWERFNSLLQTCGIKKDGPVFKIYHDVYTFLNKATPDGLSKESKEKWLSFYKALTVNIWQFYYQVAFTYDLAIDDQEYLLEYLVQCFSEGEEKEYFDRARQWSYGDFDWGTWNDKYLALWEKGAESGSVFAMCQLADCYYKRIGVDLKDYDKAFSLYQRAARLGSLYAVYMLGQCYEYSRGTKTDYQKAGDCYRYAYEVAKSQDPASILTQDCAKAVGRLYDGNRWDKNRYSPDIFTCDTPVMKKANLDNIKQDLAKCMQADLDTVDLSILAVSIGMINEEIINSFIECYESGYQKEKPSEQIKILRNRGYFTKEIFYQTTTVRSLRNRGAHNRTGEPITLDEIKQAMRYIKNIVEYYENY